MSTTSSKRRREETVESEKAGYVRLVDEELCQLVGQRFLLESQLAKADLLEFLTTKGFIREVKGIVEVEVQPMDGSNFGVALEEGGTVADLKSEIQEAHGTALYRQELFVLREGAKGGSEAHTPLPDDHEIGGSCTVMLCVQVEEEWSWDASSPLLERKMFELRGPNKSVAAKIDEEGEHEEILEHCMMAGQVMEADTGKHIISMQIETTFGGITCGVVSDGAACDESHTHSTVGWFMNNVHGALLGNGKNGDDAAGRIDTGDVLTMQIDTDAGTLRFWVNGEPHGPGFTNGVRGPLRWAMSIHGLGHTIAIVPTPALQLWRWNPDNS